MKLEILAKRLADKTDCPELEAAILGQTTYMDLPDGCLIWTGGKSIPKKKIRPAMRRDASKLPYIIPVTDQPRAQITYNGSRHYVVRLVFELLMKPDTKFRLENTCGNTLCISPFHWSPVYEEKEIEIDDVPDDIFDLTLEEADSLVELMLGSGEPPQDWTQVLSSLYMEDVPHNLIEDLLREKRKGHLLP